MMPKQVLSYIFTSLLLIHSYYAAITLGLFLARQQPDVIRTGPNWWQTIGGDLGSGVAFVVQHGLGQKLVVRSGSCWVKRSLYIVTTNLALLLIVNVWQPVGGLDLWHLDTHRHHRWAGHVFSAIHFMSGYLVYVSTFIISQGDMFGLVQLCSDMTCGPQKRPKVDLQLVRLQERVKHGSFTGLLVILWAHPQMTIDRLMLASLLTTFMYLAWTPKKEDLKYQKDRWEAKSRQIACSFT